MRRAAAALFATIASFALATRAIGAPPPEDGELEEGPPASAAPSASAAPPVTRPRGEGAPLVDGMLRIPGGTFQMGSSDEKSPANERPPHAVTVKPFFLDRTEVTVGAYRACVTEKRCAPPARTSVQCTYDLGDAELPVTCVHWTDAEAFCRARKKRLPSEAEWEFAARGTSGQPYPWGGTRSSCAVAVTLVRDTTSLSCSGTRPARVGAHPAGASPFGVLDLSGNVEEWVQDYYAEHLAYVAPRAGASHVLRGGGYLSTPSASRATSRNWGSSLEAGPNVGFRCARDGA